jgi:hypothetical protein
MIEMLARRGQAEADALSPVGLLALARSRKAAEDRAAADVLDLAARWADLHSRPATRWRGCRRARLAQPGARVHTRWMSWARAALTGGLLVLLVTFGVGTENALSTTVMGRTQHCGSAIPTSWLMSGSDYPAQPGSVATDDEKRAEAACGPIVHESRVLVFTIMGVGGLLVLVGWTAISTRREVVSRTVTHARV